MNSLYFSQARDGLWNAKDLVLVWHDLEQSFLGFCLILLTRNAQFWKGRYFRAFSDVSRFQWAEYLNFSDGFLDLNILEIIRRL